MDIWNGFIIYLWCTHRCCLRLHIQLYILLCAVDATEQVILWRRKEIFSNLYFFFTLNNQQKTTHDSAEIAIHSVLEPYLCESISDVLQENPCIWNTGFTHWTFAHHWHRLTDVPQGTAEDQKQQGRSGVCQEEESFNKCSGLLRRYWDEIVQLVIVILTELDKQHLGYDCWFRCLGESDSTLKS